MRAFINKIGILFLVQILSCCSTSLNGDQKYKNFQVIRILPTTEADVAHLKSIQDQGNFDFLKSPTVPGNPVDVIVPRRSNQDIRAQLTRDMFFTVIVPNLYEQILKDRQRNQAALENSRYHGKKLDWTAYYEYEEIMNWLEELAGRFPSLVTVANAGKSYEGRTMKILKISTGGTNKPSIFVDGGIHAREWISPATVTYIMNEILNNATQFSDVLDEVDLYFMPLINPDGYAFTFADDRYWRKTRSVNEGYSCYGTDPNRNWNFHWGESGSSNYPCSDIYGGSAPFSEIEMRNVRDELLDSEKNIKVYLSFHSYGQYWMYPWGYGRETPEDEEDLAYLANISVDALSAVYGTQFTVGQSSKVLYSAAGGSDDYAKGVAGIKYSYTVELRDKGAHGFLLPPDQIIPTGTEVFEAFKVIMKFVKNNYS